jgi:hypothetical protein
VPAPIELCQTAETFDLELLTRPLEFGEVFLDERVQQFRERLRAELIHETAGCSYSALAYVRRYALTAHL